MSIKSILSAYSGDASKGSGLRHALRLAKHHDAWLTGVLRHRQSNLERTLRGSVPKTFLKTFFEAEETRLNEIAERFRTITIEAGYGDRSDFVDLDVEQGRSLSEFARTFDLVVTGVHSHSENEAHMSANPDLIALRSGRPVLVVPDAYEAEGLTDHALVAWDGKRSSARALGDAMVGLEDKAKVTLLTVGSEKAPGTEYLLRNLERHGIDATLVLKPRKGSIAETILSTAQDVSAELVVMGAFEHSKFSHDVFGGVTTDVIEKTDVPIFMSH
ncbi:universal stress protein [Rhodalgimonas zhirmunskyi]|uniref:Universal stress protein n=1 Tax=Rhodalgimonas zhirmunskyi TaxID=2964767 RepID=A0AAJ1UBQ3_9RHOB|nr:universal stress protein [Rhodoalgimonas zhirmunskyi]MDQ2095565.1 universal stress protein [Rhodoalgimonas zhirmunskyi]